MDKVGPWIFWSAVVIAASIFFLAYQFALQVHIMQDLQREMMNYFEFMKVLVQ